MNKLDIFNFALLRLGRDVVGEVGDEEVGVQLGYMWGVAVEWFMEEVKPGWGRRVVRLVGVGRDDVGAGVAVGGVGWMPGMCYVAGVPDGVCEVLCVDGAGWLRLGQLLFWDGDEGVRDVLVTCVPGDEWVWSSADGEVIGLKLACLVAFVVTGSAGVEERLGRELNRGLYRAQYRHRQQDMGRGGVWADRSGWVDGGVA